MIKEILETLDKANKQISDELAQISNLVLVEEKKRILCDARNKLQEVITTLLAIRDK